jgi:hypothetical protein
VKPRALPSYLAALGGLLWRMAFEWLFGVERRAVGDYTCPVCEWAHLSESPFEPTYEICPQCGVEFGYDDFTLSHAELRERWVAAGRPWFSTVIRPPARQRALERFRHGAGVRLK